MSDTAPTAARSVDGILNLAKPCGMTSHDVVDRVRRIVGTRRVGHAGTLDPDAAGVLLVCVGAATRLSDYLMGGTKRYRASIRFGATSTTDDRAGAVTTAATIDRLTEDVIRGALPSFVGDIEQVPPAFSAIKVSGQPLYKRARAGETVNPTARRVTVERIEVISWRAPDLVMDVVCSKGTYIRALARDLGGAVGTGAYLLALLRTASGRFELADGVTLEELERAKRFDYISRLLYPIDDAVRAWPTLLLDDAAVTGVRNGMAWIGPPGTPGEEARGIAVPSGRLVALLEHGGNNEGWQPRKVLDGSAGA